MSETTELRPSVSLEVHKQGRGSGWGTCKQWDPAEMKRLMPLTLFAGNRLSWNSLVRPAFSIVAVPLLWLASAGSGWAYTSVRVAIDSNILVDGKRVIFAQGTGSLTILNLETGAVLLRKKPGSDFDYSGKLRRTLHGVLMMSYDRIALLDGNTFEPVWRAERCYGAVFDGEHVVTHDGNHTVICRSVQSGKVAWKVDMEGGWRLLAANGKVIVSTAEHSDRHSALLILDIASGGQILRHEAALGVHWHQVYFDGQHVYLAEGNSAERISRRPDQLKTLDLEGKVVAKAAYNSPEVIANTSREDAVFIWSDKYFADGQVQPVTAHVRNTLADLWKKGDDVRDMLENDREFFRRKHYHPKLLQSGILTNFPSKDADNAVGQLIQMITSRGSWTAYGPHLGEYGTISHVVEADGKLLSGSTEGHLECMDIESGRPRWLYAFPVVRQTVSYSSPYGMPPYLTQRAAEYRKCVEEMNVPSGSIVLPFEFQPASTTWAKLRTEMQYPGQIVIDPDPDDPYRRLGRYVIWLAVCASLPIAGALVLHLRRLTRRKSPIQGRPDIPQDNPRASAGLVAWFLVLSVSPAYGLLQYGRVSYSWTIALKVIFAVTILFAVFGTVRLWNARRWMAAILYSLILIGWVLFMLDAIRFA